MDECKPLRPGSGAAADAGLAAYGAFEVAVAAGPALGFRVRV